MTAVAIDTSDAERRALKIGLRLDAIADNYEAVMPMIREALELGDHLTLGYRSPGEYLADRFGRALARLPIPVRREAVKELTSAGLSTRAIASVVGVAQPQVVRDIQAARQVIPGVSPAPSLVTQAANAGLSIAREKHGLPPFDPTTGELLDDVDTADTIEPAPRRTTGLDGKSYPKRNYTPPSARPAPLPIPEAKPRATPRRALTDQFFDAAFDLGRAVEKVHHLVSDDRWTNNKAQIAAKHAGDLRQAADLLAEVLRAMPTSDNQ